MKLSRAELWIDLGWVAISAFYISQSLHYPPAARLIPMVVGIGALIVGLFQLCGNFVPALRPWTHDRTIHSATKRTAEDDAQSGPVREGAAVTSTAAEIQRVWIAAGWATGLVAGLFILGFVVAIPLFFLTYFLIQPSQRNWKLAVGSAIVMGALTYGVFDQALGLNLYNGVLFTNLLG